MAQGVCAVRMSYLSISPSLFMCHPPSLLFPHGHFEITFPSAPSSSNCTRPESAGQAHFRTSAEEFGYLADPAHSTGYEPKEFDKVTSVDGDTTPINDLDLDSISDFSRKPHARVLDCSMFPQCLKPLFRQFLTVVLLFREREREQRKHASGNRCKTVREKREGSVISVAESMSRKSRRNSIRGHSLQTQRILFWRTRSPRTPGTKSSTSGSVLKFSSEKIIIDWVRHGDPKFGAKKFRICIDWVATRARISRTTIAGSQSMGSSSSAWHNTLVQWVGNEESSSPGMPRKKLPRNWRLEKTLLWRRKME